MILLIDNYDSFVHNLARYLRRLGQETLVVRNDKTDAAEISRLDPQAVVLSPGPRAPQQAGCCLEVVEKLHHVVPILGVCLGHQVIAEAFGGRVVRASMPAHGRASQIRHCGRGIFACVPNPFYAGRYHSLVAETQSLPDCLQATAWLEDHTIMALQHRELPVVGWQFHPESVLTRHGYPLLKAFLSNCGLASDTVISSEDDADLDLAQQDWFRKAIDLSQ